MNHQLKILILLFFTGGLFAQNAEQTVIEDGMYHVVMLDTSATELSILEEDQRAIFFSQLFNEYKLEGYLRLIIDASDFVPLQLSEAPTTEKISESKKNLLLQLNKMSTKKLATFTEQHLYDHVAIVVNGEALTMHVIKAPITNGKMQISCCHDNACEQLYIQLKDNVLSK